MTETEAFEYLKNWRWPDGIPKCPRCGCEAYVLTSKAGLYRCKNKVIEHDFAATRSTAFHYRKKPPQECVKAIEILKACPKITPIEFMRASGWTYKGSWMFLDRVRAM